MKYELHHGDCLPFLMRTRRRWHTIFADPFDNIGLGYEGFKDKISDESYMDWTGIVIEACLRVAPVVYWSFNAKHTVMMGAICHNEPDWIVKPMVQTYTFYQHNHNDHGNAHRPLWRITRDPDLKLYTDAIRVPSWRQLNGDKRADPRGKVPGDVFDFPRVTGNSKQRRKYHPTQLHEGLVERALRVVTPPKGRVLDPFGGTGTTLRAAKTCGYSCTLLEQSRIYCDKLVSEHTDIKEI